MGILSVSIFSIFTPRGNVVAGLMGYWKFDEGSGNTVADSSGNGNTGTLYNGPVWVDGKYGKALSFDGSSTYVRVEASSSLDVTSQVTVEVWVYARVYVDNVGDNPHIVSRTYLSGASIHILNIYGGTHKVGFGVNPFPDQQPSTADLPSNVWTHIAMTYDGTYVRFYMNGELDSSYAQSGPIQVTSNWLAFGCMPTARHGGSGTWAFFNGMIDEVRIYNRALSQQEIQTDMGGPAPPPVTYDVFFEGSGVGNPVQVWSVTLDGYGTEYSNGPGNTIHTVIFTGIANGGPYQFTVTPPSGFVAQPTTGPITVNGGDVHQSITFTSVPVTYTFTLTAGSGGTVSYSFSLSGACGSGTVSSGQSQQLTVPQSCQFSLTANPDSLYVFQTWSTTGSVSVSDPSSASTTATVNGNGGVNANFAYNLGVSISPTSASIQLGESVAFTATASGGSGGYTYVWHWMQYGMTPPNDGSQSTGASNKYTFTPTYAGDYGVYVIVTDSGGNNAQSLASPVTVRAPPENVVAKPLSNGIRLTWNAPPGTDTPTKYDVFRGTSPDFSISLLPYGSATTLKFDDSVSDNTIYYYRVVAEYSDGSLGAPSDPVVSCARLESVKGVANELTGLNTLSITKWYETITVQQNFFICTGGQNPKYYWCQNSLEEYVTIHVGRGIMYIWGPFAYPKDHSKISWDSRTSLGWGTLDGTFSAISWIDGTSLVMENTCQGKETFPLGLAADAYIYTITNNYSPADPLEDSSPVAADNYPPNFVVVGHPEGGTAWFTGGSGSVFSCASIGNTWKWGKNIALVTHAGTVINRAATAEDSYNLTWTKDGSFSYQDVGVDEGVFFVPDFASQTTSKPRVSGLTTPAGAITIEAKCPVYINVYDDNGRFLGFNSTSGAVEAEIPTAIWRSNQSIIIFDPKGTYQTIVTGTENGAFALQIVWQNESGDLTTVWNSTETVNKGQIIDYHIFIGSSHVPIVDNTPPTTNIEFGRPSIKVDGRVFVATSTSISLKATDNQGGSSVSLTAYRIYNATYESGWLVYTEAFNLSSLTNGNYTVAFNGTDNVGNVENTNNLNVTLIGPDINGDGQVELMDFFIAGTAFGSYPGHPRWNPIADLNLSGMVEMMDFFILSQHYLGHL
jgi:hypothetical protein